MQDGHKVSITILQSLKNKSFISYEMEIQTESSLYIYQARYSELYELFYTQTYTNFCFPYKYRLFSLLAPFWQKETWSNFQNHRCQEMKAFFKKLNREGTLQREEGFRKLVDRARDSQRKVMKKPTLKARNLQQQLNKETKCAYVLI